MKATKLTVELNMSPVCITRKLRAELKCKLPNRIRSEAITESGRKGYIWVDCNSVHELKFGKRFASYNCRIAKLLPFPNLFSTHCEIPTEQKCIILSKLQDFSWILYYAKMKLLWILRKAEWSWDGKTREWV